MALVPVNLSNNRSFLRWQAGDPNADEALTASDTPAPLDAPRMPAYDGLVFNSYCVVCAAEVTALDRDCICVDYRGLKRSQCQDGLFFPTLRTKNAWIVLRRNPRRVRTKRHKIAWRMWRLCQRDILLHGHPVLRTVAGNRGDPRIENHIRSFLEYVFWNYQSLGHNNCVVCGDVLDVNRSFNFCNTCKSWKLFQDIWEDVNRSHGPAARQIHERAQKVARRAEYRRRLRRNGVCV